MNSEGTQSGDDATFGEPTPSFGLSTPTTSNQLLRSNAIVALGTGRHHHEQRTDE